MELIGLYLAACYLLVVAGASKTVRPDDTARALAALPPARLPFRAVRGAVRAAAAVELALGLVALALPHAAFAWLVAASYGVFALFVGYVRSSQGALASCGCFGTPDTPPTALHVLVDVGLCGAAAAIALFRPAGSMLTVLAHQPGRGVPLAVVSALFAWLCFLALTALAGLQAARAPSPSPAPSPSTAGREP